MNKLLLWMGVFALLTTSWAQQPEASQTDSTDGWTPLFDGESLDGWKASEREGTFSVEDGKIVVHGKRSHLYYVGPVQNANFKNFELKADVYTLPGSNSGIYFHTEFQEGGWPAKGYEVQVNNSHSDWRRTGSLYNVVNLREVPSQDNEWFTQHIMVRDNHIVVKIDGETVIDYTEPENVNYEGMPGRKISSGTFCLQGHDPKSIVHFKNIRVKPLP